MEKAPPSIWGKSRMRPDRDLHAAQLKARFRAVRPNRNEPIPVGRFFCCALGGAALGFGAVALYIFLQQFDWLDEPVSAPSAFVAPATCADARRMGIAPMRRGDPGFRRSLDADDDGTACEPYPR